MKILHTSDLHIDSPLTTRLDSKKVRERKSELLLSFKDMTECAAREGAEGFIIAGDLFDSSKVAKRTLKNIIDVICATPEIRFYYLSGNHERDALLASGLTLPENLFLFGSDWTYFRLGDVNIIGRSEISADMFSSLRLNGSEKNVIVLHGELRDRTDSEEGIGKKELAELPVDYLALGHYHSYSQTRINDRCTAVYCGTPEGRGFDEAGPCGYVMIDVDRFGASHRFVRSARRELHILDTEISENDSDISAVYKLESVLAKIPKSDLVRIRLVGNRALGQRMNPQTLISSVGKGYYYVEIKDETRVKISADDFKNDISLKGEFIRGVLADTTLSDKEKDSVITLGLEVLIGEEDIG